MAYFTRAAVLRASVFSSKFWRCDSTVRLLVKSWSAICWLVSPLATSCRIKKATVQRYYYESTAQLHEYLQTSLLPYHHAKRLKRLYGLTPHELVCAQWQKNPTIFNRDPAQLTRRIYTVG